jgi:hypothetical protein
MVTRGKTDDVVTANVRKRGLRIIIRGVFLRSTRARMLVLRGRCVGLVLTGFALDVGLDFAF